MALAWADAARKGDRLLRTLYAASAKASATNGGTYQAISKTNSRRIEWTSWSPPDASAISTDSGPADAVEPDADPRIVSSRRPKVADPEVAGLGTRLRPSGDHRAEFGRGGGDESPVLVPDSEQRSLSRRGIGLLQRRRELEPWFPGFVQ